MSTRNHDNEQVLVILTASKDTRGGDARLVLTAGASLLRTTLWVAASLRWLERLNSTQRQPCITIHSLLSLIRHVVSNLWGPSFSTSCIFLQCDLIRHSHGHGFCGDCASACGTRTLVLRLFLDNFTVCCFANALIFCHRWGHGARWTQRSGVWCRQLQTVL